MKESISSKRDDHSYESNDHDAYCAVDLTVRYSSQGRAAQDAVDDTEACDSAKIEGNND